MKRPSNIEIALSVAKTVALRSHDKDTKVGAVLINEKTGSIIATGFNGFVRGAPDDILPNTRPLKYNYIVHAEANVIYHCARLGISMANCFLVCTLSPCMACMRALWQTGVTKVYCEKLYKDYNDILAMQDIKIEHYKEQGMHVLKYVK